MSDALPDLERRLFNGYQDQLSLYDQAIAVVAGPRSAVNDWAQDLHGVLGEVMQRDAAMADDKIRWRQSGVPSSSSLSALIDQVAQRIASLGDEINRQVADLTARRDKLMPEIDEFIRRRRMLEAYGQYGDRHAHVANYS